MRGSATGHLLAECGCVRYGAKCCGGLRCFWCRVTGNLKYDVRAPEQSRVAELIREAVGDRPLVVAGSTVEGKEGEEEPLLMQYWPAVLKEVPEAMIVVAPRHPERFAAAYSVMKEYGTVRATELLAGTAGPVTQGGNILL